MKRFLSNITLFILPIVIVLGVSYFMTTRINYELPLSINTIVIGDSRIARGLNDSLFQHTLNLSAGGDTYLISYLKIMKLKENNPQLKKVILGFHDKSLSAYAESWYDIDWQGKIPRYWFLNISEMTDYYGLTQYLVRVISFATVKNIYKYLKAKSLNQSPFGGYRHLIRNKLDLDLELHSKPMEYFPPDSAKNQIMYLRKIVKYCKQNNLEIILLTPPMYFDSPYYTTYHHSYLKHYFKEICYLDYATYEMPRYCYGDIDHLNYKGANIFSRVLARDLDFVWISHNCNGYHVY